MSDIPDSISFSTLRELRGEKINTLDFSEPVLSDNISDLAFLVTQFITAKTDGVFSHQQVFLADVVVTNLARLYKGKLDKACESGADPKQIAALAEFAATLQLVETALDDLVSICMKSIGNSSTLPSYRLVKCLDPSVRPHEIEEWIKGLSGH